jgi:hypothetical protein
MVIAGMYFIYEYGRDFMYFGSKGSRNNYCNSHFGVYTFEVDAAGEEIYLLINGNRTAMLGLTCCP